MSDAAINETMILAGIAALQEVYVSADPDVRTAVIAVYKAMTARDGRAEATAARIKTLEDTLRPFAIQPTGMSGWDDGERKVKSVDTDRAYTVLSESWTEKAP